MPGWGQGPWGHFPFGEWEWSRRVLYDEASEFDRLNDTGMK